MEHSITAFEKDLEESTRDDVDEGLKSNIARNESSTAERTYLYRRDNSQSTNLFRRAAHQDRSKLKVSMYTNSLLALSINHTLDFGPNLEKTLAHLELYEKIKRMADSAGGPRYYHSAGNPDNYLPSLMAESDIDMSTLIALSSQYSIFPGPNLEKPQVSYGSYRSKDLRTKAEDELGGELTSTTSKSDNDMNASSLGSRYSETERVGDAPWPATIKPNLMWVCNIATLVWQNFTRLQDAHIVRDIISAIVLLQVTDHVVELRGINVLQVEQFIDSLNSTVWSVNEGEEVDFVSQLSHILEISSGILQILLPSRMHHLKMITELHRKARRTLRPTADLLRYIFGVLYICEITLERVDLAILSYESAHMAMANLPGSFGSFEEDTSVIAPRNFLSLHLRRESVPSYFKQLPLQCLAPLIDHRDVWVFCDERQSIIGRYYLSTEIDTFADVWGPVWKVPHNLDPDMIAKYNVGGGSIVPWLEGAIPQPPLAGNQRFCHWTSNVDLPDDDEESSVSSSKLSNAKEYSVTTGLKALGSTSIRSLEERLDANTQVRPFRGSERLLIGAKTDPQLEWRSCHCVPDTLKRVLKEAGRLSHMLASKSYRYIDSQQASLVIGSHGIQTGRNVTYKTVKEDPLKIGLLTMWENQPGSRDPREFENFWGVAVSLCTMNARRVRLVELLGEYSVLSLLKHHPWSDQDAEGGSQRRRRFFKAVRSSDPRALGDLWDQKPTWRKDLGDALLLCLRILVKTGYDQHRHEFNMLWLPPGCHGPRRVTLRSVDQTWTTVLKDNTYSMTVAAIIDDKLGDGPPCNQQTSQWFRRPSVLETAISLNRDLEPIPKLCEATRCVDSYERISRLDGTSWKNMWDVHSLSKDELLWIGPEERLKVVKSLSKWHLLVGVDTVKRAILRNMIGMRPSERLSHWEYTDEGAESADTRPLPVHITS